MSLLLYAVVRFHKPKRMLEIGSGYTSVFMLQALRDNDIELDAFQKRHREAPSSFPKHTWVVPSEVNGYHHGRLTCVDNLGHKSTTAAALVAVAEELGLGDHLEFEEGDAFEHARVLEEEGEVLDLLWVDFGDGDRLDEFFELYWNLVKPSGGLILVHSTCTNSSSKSWLAALKCKSRDKSSSGMGLFDVLSLLEPHKMRQNSVTMIQRRGFDVEPYDEPCYTKYA